MTDRIIVKGDWDLLRATQETLREHMALLKQAWAEIAAKDAEISHHRAQYAKNVSKAMFHAALAEKDVEIAYHKAQYGKKVSTY